MLITSMGDILFTLLEKICQELSLTLTVDLTAPVPVNKHISRKPMDQIKICK